MAERFGWLNPYRFEDELDEEEFELDEHVTPLFPKELPEKEGVFEGGGGGGRGCLKGGGGPRR